MRRYGQVFTALFLVCTLSFCSSNHTPAPIVELNTPKEYKEINRGRLKAKNYIVKKGDTLYSIAFDAGMEYQTIANVNDISPPYSIYPGQELSLQASKKRQVKKPTTRSSQNSKKPSNQVVDPPKKQAYGGPVSKAKSSEPSLPEKVSRWVWPTVGKVVERFALTDDGNKGIDISNKIGTPVKAAAAGKVVYTGNALRGYGNLIIINHDQSYLSAYAFNHKIMVKEQDWVKAGQQIAQMGRNDSGQPLLHFEIRYKGKSVNPERYLPKK